PGVRQAGRRAGQGDGPEPHPLAQRRPQRPRRALGRAGRRCGAQPRRRDRGRPGSVAAAERVSIMKHLPRLRRACTVLGTVLLLAGFGHTEKLTVATPPTLPPPPPGGMQQFPPEAPLPMDDGSQNCDLTASLRPFPTKAEADAAVADIRARGRLIVGLDIGSNLFSFRDPISGEITGFDVDIAAEISRDIFGSPSHVEYRILSSSERITALQNSEVDVVVKTMTITCDRRKDVNFSTVYLDTNQRILAPRDSPIVKVADLSGRRVCVAKGTTSLRRIQQAGPPPIMIEVVNWADCLVAMQQREIDAGSTGDSTLAGLVS